MRRAGQHAEFVDRCAPLSLADRLRLKREIDGILPVGPRPSMEQSAYGPSERMELAAIQRERTHMPVRTRDLIGY